jgi:serpin B
MRSRQLVRGELVHWLAELHDELVEVFLPRFHAESTLNLIPSLEALGAKRAFAPGQADFSGIDGARDLFIQLVRQVAVLDVDERGTEAAAATVVALGPEITSLRGPPPRPIIFRADHPFAYFVRDRETGAVLFAGRLVTPARYP